MNKKGSARDVILIGVMLFVFGIAFLTFYKMGNTAFDAMINNTVINQSNNTVSVLQDSKDLTNRLDGVFFALFIGFLLMLIITSWFIAGNPIFVFIYFIMITIGVTVSAVLSNVWGVVADKPAFISLISSGFPMTNHILDYLPIYLSVVGFVGLIVMFAKPYFQEI